MKYLITNEYWKLNKDYNVEKLLYLLIDRPDEINSFGDLWWLNKDNELNRNYDLPAVEHPNGTKEWYLNGKLYREDGPAVEYSNGTKCWYLNGKLHREDGPAVEYSNGTKYWFLNGIRQLRYK